MLGEYRHELARLFKRRVRELYDIDHTAIVEVPPRRDLGDLALPGALQLARELKRNPREIGQEIADGFDAPDWVREIKVQGAGFLNVYLDRGRVAAGLMSAPLLDAPSDGASEKVIVEHTNINPNKAAHIGHLRNAVLGDVLSRLLRALGRRVEIQNYIDDTGVQLADVVVGFLDLRGLTGEQIAALDEPFDFYCWDLYSEVGSWYDADESRLALRRETLQALEHDRGERAEIGKLVARRVVKRHLETMARLGIGYDLLTHESAILHRDFFARAFEQLKLRGAVRLEESGKNAGCWVMPLAESEEFAGLEDPDKVIVRSDGTATYVAKDIAYQLWKFGLLGEDFGYRFWDEAGIWQTVAEDAGEHPLAADGEKRPDFGAAERVINVIDARQSYLQKVVRVGLERLGFESQAERSIHFAYEMVSLSTGAARQLGFLSDDETDEEAGSLEMSGRRGIGVKADDLIDQLIAKSRDEIRTRNRELGGAELDELAAAIATAALRFFMTKATTTRVIAFDFDEALNFEGESGPYLLYSLVRAGNIWRRLEDEGLAAEISAEEVAGLPAELWSDDLWDLVFAVAQTGGKVETAGDTLEISLVARHALDLAQKFNALYHKHPILQEKDDQLRAVRLATTRVFAAGMRSLCELLGLPTPERM